MQWHLGKTVRGPAEPPYLDSLWMEVGSQCSWCSWNRDWTTVCCVELDRVHFRSCFNSTLQEAQSPLKMTHNPPLPYPGSTLGLSHLVHSRRSVVPLLTVGCVTAHIRGLAGDWPQGFPSAERAVRCTHWTSEKGKVPSFLCPCSVS